MVYHKLFIITIARSSHSKNIRQATKIILDFANFVFQKPQGTDCYQIWHND